MNYSIADSAITNPKYVECTSSCHQFD
uniref:Uncharacterized protein n=1 Tax=Arundo donax TaxID=35708 RepID=A0A0A9HRU7_ARUDO